MNQTALKNSDQNVSQYIQTIAVCSRNATGAVVIDPLTFLEIFRHGSGEPN
jgi:hypothetical protein